MQKQSSQKRIIFFQMHILKKQLIKSVIFLKNSIIMDSVQKRIGLSCTHYWALFILFILEIINGYQIVIVSLISPLLKEQWSLNDDVEDIPLAFYFGIIVGSLAAGSMANLSGRKLTLFFGLCVQVISSVGLIFFTTFIRFLITLVFSGMGFGIILIMSGILLSELLAPAHRGTGLLMLSFVAIMGKLFGILFTFIEELENWRHAQLCVTIAGLAVLPLVWWKLPESVRILLAKGEKEEGFQILEKMLKEQNKPCLESSEKAELSKWSEELSHSSQFTRGYSELFNKKLIKMTVILSVGWFAANFMFYGQLFIMPFLFEKEHEELSHFAVMICGEIPSIFFTVNMIERESIGRKYSLVIFFFLTAIANAALVFYPHILLIALSRLCMKSVIQILYPFTAESYSTPLRSKAFAYCSGIGRMGSILMPMLVYPLYEINIFWVFVAFMGLSLIGFSASLYGDETLNREMEKVSIEAHLDQKMILTRKEVA